MASCFIDMMYWKKVDTGRIDRACVVRKNISNIEVACKSHKSCWGGDGLTLKSYNVSHACERYKHCLKMTLHS